MAVTHRVQAPEINPMRISLDRYHAFIEAGLFEDADSSLRTDRQYKTFLYAEAGIPEYWIVNLPDRRVERYALPQGDTYHEITELTAGDELTPRLGRPTIAVADLFAAAFREGQE